MRDPWRGLVRTVDKFEPEDATVLVDEFVDKDSEVVYDHVVGLCPPRFWLQSHDWVVARSADSRASC
jgi:hypothetical protein